MTTEDMTKRAAGVYLRPGSSVWQWALRAPDDLRSVYPTQWAFRCSLKTSDLLQANDKAAVLNAEWRTRFSEQRKALNPQRVEHVTPEMGKLLAERVTAFVLGTDAALRRSPEKARLLLDVTRAIGAAHRGLRIGPYVPPAATAEATPLDPLDGLPLPLLLELADVNEAISKQAAIALATQRVAAILPLVTAEARTLGLHFDHRVVGGMDALRECLSAYRKAKDAVTKRDDGEAIETPVAPAIVAMKQAKPTRLRDVLLQWKASKKRKPQTEKAAELALELYEKATGNPPIGTLTRALGVDCRAYVLANSNTAKTARDRFDYIKGFLNFASRELEMLPRNPWEGLAIEYATTTPRRPWSGEQLAALFSRPLFTAYDLPSDWHAGGDAAYWIPILGIYTGARSGELCQLLTVDVETVDRVPIIRISDQGEGQSVKTDAGRREVPVHPELIRLGFMEYVTALREAGAARLFPALRLAPTKASNYFSAWFKTQRAVEAGAELPDFHSFRHTVRSKLAKADIAEPMIDLLLGHEGKGSTGAQVYTHRDMEDYQRAMSALAYQDLALPRVFTKPTATTTPAPSKRGRPAKR